MACFALGFTACSDDPEDAVSKHVYGPDEAPYLRADAGATISVNAEFRKGHIAPKTIYLKDYAEQIQTKMKMTVDDMLAGVDHEATVHLMHRVEHGLRIKIARSLELMRAPLILGPVVPVLYDIVDRYMTLAELRQRTLDFILRLVTLTTLPETKHPLWIKRSLTRQRTIAANHVI